MTWALLALRNRRRILSLLAALLVAFAAATLVVTLAAGGAVQAASAQQSRTGNAALAGCITSAGGGDALAGMTTEQQANAVTIVATTQARGLPPRAAVIALATAYQETKFINYLTHTDSTTSLGLFAQMTVYYGYDVATNPAKATSAFLDILVQQPNWQTRPLTDVAADVQRPYEPYRGLYAQWETLATKITGQLWQASSPCAASAGAASSVPGPAGLTLTGSEKGNGAVAFAMAQIGEPYLWGATGPDRWDCSGLMLGAWASVGVGLTRVTYTQANEGTPVTQADARSGDLVLIAGSDGTTANPGHVGMVAGRGADGQTWLVEAPRTGLNVRLTPMSGWSGQIVTIRRIG
jgi:cell wall-associated NlpC family hydrolase